MKRQNTDLACRLTSPLIIALLLTLLTSCGLGREASGVLVWADKDSPIAQGAFLYIWDQSRIRKTFTVQDETGGPQVEIPVGRVMYFKDEGEARGFHKAFQSLKTSFAYATKQGHPLREEPEPSSRQIYKLRDGERLKVLSRSSEKTRLTTREGYWYQLLTEDGHWGWSFDAYLRIVDAANPQETSSQPGELADPYLRRLFEASWRPDDYEPMIEAGTIDLETFKDEYGLRASYEEKTVSVTLPQLSTVFAYSAILNIAQGDPVYQFEGAPLRIRFTAEDRMTATFNIAGKETAKSFYILPEELEVTDLVSREISRRKASFERFMERGNTLSSPAYGSIVIQDDRSFVWSGNEILKGKTLPEGEGNTQGMFEFDHFPAQDLKSAYDGVVTLIFSTNDGPRPVLFLYKFSADGVQMVSVADKDATGKIVQRESRQAVTLFFRFSRE